MSPSVVLIQSEEGYAVGCPAMPGCWTQGATKTEALENIREAMALWLESGGVPLEQSAEQLAWKQVLDEAVEAGLSPERVEGLLQGGLRPSTFPASP